jgi:hypothetical protein
VRYTAKARMLSFDFLPDDVVYDLPPMQALLLAGMIARADNLGRLPGDPSVLLAYLFFPKPPRPDATDDEAESLLIALASRTPPVVLWYQSGASRYVQFRSWKVHQAGLREHNLKSTLPGPETEGAFPVVEGGQPSLFDAPRPAPCVKLDNDAVRNLVALTARQHSMSTMGREFKPADVVDWAKNNNVAPDTKGAVAFAHWLWNTGVTNMDSVLAVLDDSLLHQAEQPYAYYAPGGAARNGIVLRNNARNAEASHEAIKKEEAAFLARKP